MSRSYLAIVTVVLLSLVKPWAPAYVPAREREPKGWDITIARASEPGDPMILTGRVLGPRDTIPWAGATVYVYHADSRGNYSLLGDPHHDPRLAGVLRTNERGEYRVRSVLPGMYDGPAHVHFEVWGGEIERRAFWVNVFTTAEELADHQVRSWTPAQAGNLLLARDSSGVYHGRWDLWVADGFRIPPDTTRSAPR